MKKSIKTRFFAVLIMLFAHNVAFLVFVDANPLQSPPQLISFFQGIPHFDKPSFNILKYPEDVCNDKICVRTPGAGTSLPTFRTPEPCLVKPKSCYIAVTEVTYNASKFMLEAGSVLPGKVFQGKSVKITPTITLILNGIKSSIRKELSASNFVEVSKVMKCKEGSNAVYVFLIPKNK